MPLPLLLAALFPSVYAALAAGLAAFAGCIVLLAAVQWLLARLATVGHAAVRRAEERGKIRRRRLLLLCLAVYPRLSVWLWACGLYTAAAWAGRGWLDPEDRLLSPSWQGRVIGSVSVLCALSLVGRMLIMTNHRLRALALKEASHWERLLGVIVVESLSIGLPLTAAYTGLPLLDLSPASDTLARRWLAVAVIAAVGFSVGRLINLAADKVTLRHEDPDYASNLRVRTLFTQVSVLRKIALVFIGFVTLASILMMFPSVRQLGTSLLASAGVLGIVAGVASQRALANFVAGFLIAVTQPILIDDNVTVEGEYGAVEEIALTYVVVRLWNQRRLVLPISYFLEKPFQNWTRQCSQSTGVVFLPLDYRTPLAPLEAEFERVLASEPLWDRGEKGFHVTDATAHGVEVRLLMSTAQPGQLFDLRCAVRRRMIEFLLREYPDALPPRLRLEGEVAGGAGAPDKPLPS